MFFICTVFFSIKIQDICQIKLLLFMFSWKLEWLLYASFGAVASSLQSSLSGCDDAGYLMTLYMQVLLFTQIPLYLSSSIFTRPFAVVLGSICSLLMVAAWTCGVYTCVLLLTQMNTVPSGIWKLLPGVSQTCWAPQNCFWDFWLIPFDLP